MRALFLGAVLLSTSSHAFTLIHPDLTAGFASNQLELNLDETSCANFGIDLDKLKAAIDSGAALWSSVPSAKMKVSRLSSYSGTLSFIPATITCVDAYSSGDDLEYIPGVTYFINPESGRPAGAVMELNGNASSKLYFNKLSDSVKSVILAHEIGHILGLGHSNSAGALMYYDGSARSWLALSQDDMDGLTWLNPRNELKGGVFGCGTLSTPTKPDNRGRRAWGWVSMGALIGIAFALSRRSSILPPWHDLESKT